jgi:hypothetical protein
MAINRRSRKKTVYHLKKNASSMAKNILSAMAIFLVIALITGGFVLYQWKNFQVNKCLNDNEKLITEILSLNAKMSRLELERNVLYQSVPDKAKSVYGMVLELDKTKKFVVDKTKLALYAKKDKEFSK